MLIEIISRDLYILFYIINLILILNGIVGLSFKYKFIVNIFIIFMLIIINSIISSLYLIPIMKAVVATCLIYISTLVLIKEKERITIGFFILVILLLFESTTLGFLRLIIKYDSMDNSYRVECLSAFICLILITALYIVNKRRHININYLFKRLKSKHYIIFIIGLIAFSFLISYISIFTLSDNNALKNVLIFIISSIITMVFIFIGFYMIFAIYKNDYYKDVLNLSEKYLIQQEEYYKAILKKERDTRKFRHDFNNHIISLKHLYNNERYEDLGKYIYSIDDEFLDFNLSIQTGNDVVNAIINHIIDKNKDIKIIWQGIVPMNIKISQMDLCTIFSNILSNAVEAVTLIKEIEDRIIRIKIEYISGMLKIDMKNKFNQININDDKLLTLKKDKDNHGFGLENVRKCITKYNGELNYKISERQFVLNIFLYNV